METIVLVVVLVAAALLMASGVWVALVLAETLARIKRPAASARRESASIVSRPDPDRS